MADKEGPKGVAPDRTKELPVNASLLQRAQAKAPNLSKEFVAEHGLDDDYLEKIARGELSPPPYVGPEPVVDLHFAGGSWQITPKGVKPEDAGKDAISR
jgi:hypothetical protein